MEGERRRSVEETREETDGPSNCYDRLKSSRTRSVSRRSDGVRQRAETVPAGCELCASAYVRAGNGATSTSITSFEEI